jgi:hypothetical protein
MPAFLLAAYLEVINIGHSLIRKVDERAYDRRVQHVAIIIFM